MADRTDINRRQFLWGVLRGGAAIGAAGALGLSCAPAKAPPKEQPPTSFWQIDPAKCTFCGMCESSCVVTPSAVKCVQTPKLCGYCKLCYGYFKPGVADDSAAAGSQLCPTGAIVRRHVEDDYYEYTIREDLCIGCGKCVKHCTELCNGSMFLQVRRDLCKNCKECPIARVCPSKAFVQVPVDKPYMTNSKEQVQ